MTQPEMPRTLTLKEAATACGTTTRALQRRIDRGTLQSVLVNERRRVPVSELVRVGLLEPGNVSRARNVAPTGQAVQLGHARATTGTLDGLDARTLLDRLLDQERRYAGLAARSETAEERIRLAEERADREHAEADRLRQALSEAEERARGLGQTSTQVDAPSPLEAPPTRSWAFWRK
jgi:hypothetical protein